MPRGIPGSQPKCAYSNCVNKARARGFCENHYRRLLWREAGNGGIEPLDDVIYKVRVRLPRGSQPYYYSKIEAAMSKVAEARRDGSLLFFAEYKLTKRLDRGM